MSHDGTGTGWNTSFPANSEERSLGAQEIRDLRTAVAIRMDKEHIALAASSAGGEHKPGSAMVYYQSADPTLRPDGTTSLTVADNGRLFIDSDTKYLYTYVSGASPSVWVDVVANVVRDGAITLAKLPDGVLTADVAGRLKMADGYVTLAKIANDTIDYTKIVHETIIEAKIAPAAVTTAKIADAAVTLAKLSKGKTVSVGTYTGNGNATGPTITCGFKPDIILIHPLASGYLLFALRTDSGGDSGLEAYYPATGTISNAIDVSVTGFQIKVAEANINGNGVVFGYLAVKTEPTE